MTVVESPKRKVPFQQRTFNVGVGSFSLPNGVKGSFKRKRLLPNGNGEEIRRQANGGHENGPPPAKRKRLLKDASPDDPSTVLAAVPPIEDVVLPKSFASVNRALRIDILKMVHKDLERRLKPRVSLTSLDEPLQPLTDELTIRARCKITLLDSSPDCKHAPPVVYCRSEDCSVKTFKNPVGSSRMARIYLDQPFIIPERDVKVMKEDGTFRLADNYRLDIEMYGLEPHHWPPLGIDPSQSSSGNGSITQRWVLLCCISDLFKRQRLSVDVYMHRYTREAMTRTSFIMDIDSRWSTGMDGMAAESCDEMDVLPSITVGARPSHDALPNGVNGHMNGSLLNEHSESVVNGDYGSLPNGSARAGSEEADGETTPNRSLRVRPQKPLYNLKVLSDKAQGKERKPRNRLVGAGAGGDLPSPADGRIVYMIQSDEVLLDSFRCIGCGIPQTSLDNLEIHLETHHPERTCELRPGKGKIPHFRVYYGYERFSREKENFAQLRKSAKAFLLERKGNRHPPTYPDEPLYQLASEKPAAPKPPTQKRQKKLQPKKILVPNTKLPLYDSVSRVRLEPGTELIPPKPDPSWWVQKHRDMIMDYVDVDLPERSYLVEWDSVCLEHRQSTDLFIPQVWLAFLKEKAMWIAANPGRQEEFFKHLGYLLLRDAIDQQAYEEAKKLVTEAMSSKTIQSRQAKSGEPDQLGGDVSPKEQASRKYPKCNTCGAVLAGMVCTLECSNSTCARQFHADCVLGEDTTMNPTTELWLCSHCTCQDSTSASAPR